jgi:hypothetical protein
VINFGGETVETSILKFVNFLKGNALIYRSTLACWEKAGTELPKSDVRTARVELILHLIMQRH